MFPGQGSQFIGMGEDLFSKFPKQCEIANQTLGYSIKDLCLQDSKRQLSKTSFTQPAIFFVSCLAYMNHTQQQGGNPAFVLGHSLGLYAALFAAEVFDLEQGLTIVAKRGKLMEDASGGGMIAVIGDKIDELSDILIHHEFLDIDIANINTQQQAVLSGKAKSIENVIPVLEAQGFTCVQLSVSGPFHSRYMETAREEFNQVLMKTPFYEPSIPVISTSSADAIHKNFLLEEMSFQLIKPVRWYQTIETLYKKHPDVMFEEIGPGNILTRMTNKIINKPN